jgi:DNA-binding XRE family transcriptional regulator
MEQKKELARMYYMNGETQKEIAQKLSVSEQSISSWANKDGREVRRASINVTRPELINKALAALNKVLDQVQASDDIGVISSLPDKLSKFASAIEKLDKKANIVSVIDVFMAFSKWMQYRATFDKEITPEFLRALNKYQDMYINEHITKM